jgi:hypothetical protein
MLVAGGGVLKIVDMFFIADLPGFSALISLSPLKKGNTGR